MDYEDRIVRRWVGDFESDFHRGVGINYRGGFDVLYTQPQQVPGYDKAAE
jgi:hypothetical protein